MLNVIVGFFANGHFAELLANAVGLFVISSPGGRERGPTGRPPLTVVCS